jgi:hypothetical protein
MPRMGRMEASFEGGQGQEGAVARYMDEWSLWIGVLLSWYFSWVEIEAESFPSRVGGKVSFPSSAVCLIWNVDDDEEDWRIWTYQFSEKAVGIWDFQMQNTYVFVWVYVLASKSTSWINYLFWVDLSVGAAWKACLSRK